METLAPVGREPGGRRARRPLVGAALRRSKPELRPRGVGEVLDLGTRLLLSRFLLLPGMAFLVWLPTAYMEEIFVPILESEEDMSTIFASMGIVIAINAAAAKLAAAVTALVTFPWLRGVPIDGALLRRFLIAVPGLIVVTAIYSVAVAAGMFTCGLASIYFGWKLMFAPLIVVLESPDPIRAIARSWTLTRTGFTRWVGVYVVSFLYTVPLTFAANEASSGVVHAWIWEHFPNLGVAATDGIVLLLTGALLTLPIAFGAAVVTVFFSDALVRREGWDLSLRLRALRERLAGSGPDGPSRPAADAGQLT